MSAYEDAPAVYVDPFLGAGAVWLRLLSPHLVPFVSWMGGKRKLADELLKLLGLRAGRPVPSVLGDACWWGWVWAVVLHPELGPQVSAMLRFWRDRHVPDPFDASLPWRRQDSRELWHTLRSYGPLEHPVEAAAQLLWLQARAASGVPVWWSGGSAQGPGFNSGQQARDEARRASRTGPEQLDLELVATTHGNGQPPGSPYRAGQKGGLVSMDGHGRGPYAAWQATSLPKGEGARVRERAANALLSPGGGRGDCYAAGQKGTIGAGGIIDPGTISHRLDVARVELVKASGGLAALGRDDTTRLARGWRPFTSSDVAERLDAARSRVVLGAVTILEADAAELTDEYAARLGARARVMLDPPYRGKTGYPAECSRASVLRIAEAWARQGGRVLVCEAEGLAADLGSGWAQERLADGEWVTHYNCDVAALRPALFRDSLPEPEPTPLPVTFGGGGNPRPTPEDRGL